MAELIIRAGKLQGKRIVLPEGEIIVGRDDACQMRLASSLVSHRHCALDVGPEGIRVRDLGSQNGTYVNDVAVTDPLLLRSGDVLRVGAALFQVPEPLSPAAKSNSKTDELPISDADIANWLTGEQRTAGPKESDTTVIHVRSSAKTDPVVASATPRPASSPSPKKTGPRSIKEEAAEIIRMHWEKVRRNQGQ